MIPLISSEYLYRSPVSLWELVIQVCTFHIILVVFHDDAGVQPLLLRLTVQPGFLSQEP